MKFRYIIADMETDFYGTNDLEVAKLAAGDYHVLDCKTGRTITKSGETESSIEEVFSGDFE